MKNYILTWKLVGRKTMTAKIHVSFVSLCQYTITMVMCGEMFYLTTKVQRCEEIQM